MASIEKFKEELKELLEEHDVALGVCEKGHFCVFDGGNFDHGRLEVLCEYSEHLEAHDL